MLLHIIKLPNWPIFRQLQLEEALLRADNRNWCIINDGTDPAIVLGISGKPEQLINPNTFSTNPIPVIRRFSGGGTVVVDQNTCFVSFICNTKDSQVQNFPDRVLCWSKEIYQDVFTGLDFQLRENDYSFGNKKFGGNAQYMCKGRWLHHSSLLWDYDPQHMDLLSLPQKMPTYRENRSHDNFLCCLKDHLPKRALFEEKLRSTLKTKWSLQDISLDQIEEIMQRPHRKSTVFWTKC